VTAQGEVYVAHAGSLAREDPAHRSSAAERPLGSFESIYRTHADFVFRVVLRLGVPRADVEDVCQEVFATVHTKLGGFAGRSSLRTWIYGIAFRAASEHRRRAYVRRERPSDALDTGGSRGAGGPPEPGIDGGTPLESLAQKQARAVLDGILEALDDDKRAVFVFYEIEQLPMAEIAEIVGCPLQTAYSRLHAARERVTAAIDRLRAKEGRS
jgi:RNA polymerase sigma-70 factor (ECF subfamily)